MKKIISVLVLFTSLKTIAQVPEDALRYSWYPQSGTARNMAIGGAMGSLGGDITSVFVNPAGIGFFKTREFVFSPGFQLNNNKASYRETASANKKNSLSLGPTGMIIGAVSNRKPANSSAFSFAANQTVNFNNRVHYSGLNNYSSFSEQFAEEFAKSGYSISDVLYSNSPMPYTAAPALYTYLIDTATINGSTYIKAAPEYLLDSGYALQQDMNKVTSGGLYELAVAYAHNTRDKIYWGASLGIPVVNYKSSTTFNELDTSQNVYNRFNSFTYKDDFTTSGIGFNLKLGVILKPSEYFRIGLTVHTPGYMMLTDTRNISLVTILEDTAGKTQAYGITSKTFTNNQDGESKYIQTSPWKAILSFSYVIREIENVKKQRGFLTADIEYVHHKGSRFRSNNDNPTPTEKNYFHSLNDVVKDEYKGAFNFRVGGELKFNIIMARLGFAYYGKPYTEGVFKASQLLYSGGLGYRNQGFFVDLTYVHRVSKDVQFPYRLQDRANTYATLNQKQGSIVATVGVKF